MSVEKVPDGPTTLHCVAKLCLMPAIDEAEMPKNEKERKAEREGCHYHDEKEEPQTREPSACWPVPSHCRVTLQEGQSWESKSNSRTIEERCSILIG